MASDWIKMRTDLYRDPKVCLMADYLLSSDSGISRYVSLNNQRDMSVTRNVMRNAVVGAMTSVWGVLRQRGRRIGNDLIAEACTLAVLDDIADMPGIGDAMAVVGWANETEDGVILPGFFNEYNSEPVKDATSNAERQRRFRERRKAEKDASSDTMAGVTNSNESNDRVREREREEKDPLNPPLGGDGIAAPQQREPRTAKGEHPHFAAFWSAYPRKVAKPKAVAAFARIDPSDATLAAMLDALSRQRASEEWTKDEGRYISHPATWLNGRRWEDLPPEVGRPPPTRPTVIYDRPPEQPKTPRTVRLTPAPKPPEPSADERPPDPSTAPPVEFQPAEF